MKKLAVLFVALFAIGTAASAQEKGDMAVGANIVYGAGNKDFSNVGIALKYRYNPVKSLRIEPSITYFYDNDHYRMWDIGANIHYQFVLHKSVAVYPLFGVSYERVCADDGRYGEAEMGSLGCNVGVGFDFELTDKLVLNAEFKYKDSNIRGAIAGIGVAYKF